MVLVLISEHFYILLMVLSFILKFVIKNVSSSRSHKKNPSLCLYGNLWNPTCVDLSLTVSSLPSLSLTLSMPFYLFYLSRSILLSLYISISFSLFSSKQAFNYTEWNMKLWRSKFFKKWSMILKITWGHFYLTFKDLQLFWQPPICIYGIIQRAGCLFR